MSELESLTADIHACRICRDQPLYPPLLPHEPNPVCILSSTARIAICGQAPGIRVNETSIPFNDPSGDRLRQWLAVSRAEFYDPDLFAIVPMGFCFPGYDRHGGDLPPRRECRQTWHDRIFAAMPQVHYILVIGQYAKAYHLPELNALSLTDSVRTCATRLQHNPGNGPYKLPLPHPSWRNSGWLKKNPWFESDLLPLLQNKIREQLAFGK